MTQSVGGANVDLTPGTMVIKCTDNGQSKIFDQIAGFTVTGISSVESYNLLERNEVNKSRWST